MLHRSFKPAKCKTSLKLAMSRLKLLKNRKDVQLKQLKRELSQLLESGQDQTARIRVEHVVREEKTIAAYELLEIYCELIAARLPIIESQKNCPIDLKEAITSVVFATPRCSDIPELQDVRKNLTAKYGKEFVSAAVELRPECGVSRMLVEKLSANTPDGPTKIKILSVIAEEHDIKWDPKSFGEKELKPQEDLLNGPSTLEKGSRMRTELSSVQPPPKVQSPPTPEQHHNASVNTEHHTRPSTCSEHFPSRDTSGSQTEMPTPHSGPRPSGTRYERMEVRHSYSGDGMNWNMEFKDATAAAQAAAESAELASMAARAAAELSSRGQYSAESHKSNIHTSRDKGNTKNDHDNPDGNVGKFYVNSHGSTKISSWSNIDRSRDEGNTKNDHDNPDGNVGKFYEDSHISTKRSSQPGSLSSNGASTDDLDKLMNDFLKGARYSKNSSFEEEAVNVEESAGFSRNNVIKQSSGSDIELVSSGQGGLQTDTFNYFAEESSINENSNMSSHPHLKVDRYSQNSLEEAVKAETSTGFSVINMNEQSIGSGAEFFSSGQGAIQSDSFNYFSEESIRKKNSNVPSHSRSSSSRGDDYDVSSPFSHPKYEIDGGEDPFDHGHLHRDTAQASSYFNASVIFDEPVSEDDHGILFVTPKYDRKEFDLYPATPGIESPGQLLSTDTWNPRQNLSGSFKKFSPVSRVFVEEHLPPKFDESSTKSAKPDELLPVSFDESEGPSSESEDEVHNSRLGRTTDPSSLPQKTNVFFRTPEKSDSANRKKDFNYSSDDEVVEVNKGGVEVSAQAQRKFGFDEEPIRQSSAELAKSQMISNDMASEPFYNQVEERKNDLSAQTSRQSLLNEVKTSNNTFPTESSFNIKDDEFFRQSSLESGNELKFGKLTGGFRHKGYMHPPYSKIPSGEASSSKKAVEDSVSSTESFPFSSVKSSVKSGVSTKVGSKSSSRTPFADHESDSDESEEEHSKREPNSRTSNKEVDNKLRLRDPVTFFDSDDEGSVEDIPKQTSNSTGRVGSGFSRRTKVTTGSGTSSRSKAAVDSETPEPNSGADARKAPSRSSYHSETPHNLSSQIENPGHWKSPPEPRAEKQSTSRPKPESSISRSSYPSETPPNPHSQSEIWGRSPPEPRPERQSIFKPMPESKNLMRNEDLKSSGMGRPSSLDNLNSSTDQATSKAIPESNISTRKENLKTSAFEPPPNRQKNVQYSEKQAISKPMQAFNFTTSKENPNPSAREQPSNPLRTASTESPKSSISSGEPPSRESSLKKGSHVHPKLPDYDTIAAQLQSLRSNH